MKYRQGELLIEKADGIKGKKLSHRIIAEGEATGHKHEVITGEAELYEDGGTLYLKVLSNEAELIHPDHNTVVLPKGDYKITTQREYVVGEEKYRAVTD